MPLKRSDVMPDCSDPNCVMVRLLNTDDEVVVCMFWKSALEKIAIKIGADPRLACDALYSAVQGPAIAYAAREYHRGGSRHLELRGRDIV